MYVDQRKVPMFDFEKLVVYRKTKRFHALVKQLLKSHKFDHITNDQLRRAALSVVLNLAEGSGKFSKPDRRNFFVVSRSSLFECIAVVDLLYDEQKVSEEEYDEIYKLGEEISKMMCVMISNLSKPGK